MYHEVHDYQLPVTYEEFLWAYEDSVFGQDLKGIVYDLYSYLRNILEGSVVKHNSIIAGPSASGKTEFYRTTKRLLEDYQCPIPVIHIDMTEFSPAGFQGAELSSIPEAILNENSYGPAIVFLDEFDKILSPLCGSSGGDLNRTIQYELLTMIEGRQIQVKQRGVMKEVDTSQTLFVALGALTDSRSEKGMGFGTDLVTEKPNFTSYDLQSLGGSIELLGRFDNVYNFSPISEEQFEALFHHLVKTLATEEQIFIYHDKEAYKDFFPYVRTQFGVREVKRMLYATIKPILIDLADETNRIKYHITIHSVNNADVSTKPVQHKISHKHV